MSSRYKLLFKKLSSKKECCFIPFVVLGDPSIDISIKIIDILVKNGADALELGMPFSDPIADGLTIQKAHLRALYNKVSIKKCFNIIENIRNKYTNIPIGILTYANLVYHKKISIFYSYCSSIGIDSILIADLPIEESNFFKKVADKYQISSIFICPPDAKTSLVKKIIKVNKEYTYLVSRPGVTGIQPLYSQKLLFKTIQKLKKYKSSPIIQGFGIYKSYQIKEILKNGIQGIICGSRIVHIIEKNIQNNTKMFIKIKKVIKKFKNETKNICV
ncbi:Tryptophan synthase alpha chain [Buchnera aphidicola (Cinara kochiana kochiana)]|uniref:Tryptophan synthase alpha chain n=1 Tax=Buchnera aphidicola (Cinara kochiana kochiana) TaxID=2518976 RepID=A0A451D5Q5_9GAMM|nr:tryptophan synthase subunit alpha [Buchnera aphidicola]VFP81095.1 Tryptophan synthase alpha chain [Buchnera aphidicola (Cinara kochiana kochiana)]